MFQLVINPFLSLGYSGRACILEGWPDLSFIFSNCHYNWMYMSIPTAVVVAPSSTSGRQDYWIIPATASIRVKMRFYSYFVGFQGEEKKGHLGILLLYCFILLLPFLFFFFLSSFSCLFPLSLWQLVLPLRRFEWHDFWQHLHQFSLQIFVCYLPSS